MQDYRVTVYYNEAKDAQGRSLGYDGYQPDHPLRPVMSLYVTAENPYAAAEVTFARMNRGSGNEDPRLDDKGLRSLSVGDVAVIDWDEDDPDGYAACRWSLSCANTGWDKEANLEVHSSKMAWVRAQPNRRDALREAMAAYATS